MNRSILSFSGLFVFFVVVFIVVVSNDEAWHFCGNVIVGSLSIEIRAYQEKL